MEVYHPPLGNGGGSLGFAFFGSLKPSPTKDVVEQIVSAIPELGDPDSKNGSYHFDRSYRETGSLPGVSVSLSVSQDTSFVRERKWFEIPGVYDKRKPYHVLEVMIAADSSSCLAHAVSEILVRGKPEVRKNRVVTPLFAQQFREKFLDWYVTQQKEINQILNKFSVA